jgi:hypothetical protein
VQSLEILEKSMVRVKSLGSLFTIGVLKFGVYAISARF